ncbi:MAG: hypothetical protein ACRCZI_04590 [Cetobacterium sp.]
MSKFKTAGVGFGSPFKSGRKDDRHVLHYQGVQQGVMSAYLEKYNAPEEPFVHHDMKLFKNQPSLMEDLSINAILFRKGPNGGTLMQSSTSSYAWRQFIFIIGENNNTPAKRKDYAEALVRHMNTQATSENYQYVRKIKLGNDLTERPLLPVDTILLDEDVLGLMVAAYEGTPLAEIATYDTIMKSFWTNLAHGKEVVEGALAEAQIVPEETGLGNGGNKGNPFADSDDDDVHYDDDAHV